MTSPFSACNRGEGAVPLAATGRTGDDEHRGRHLAAKVSICLFPHITGKILANPFPGRAGYTEPLQFFGSHPDSFTCAFGPGFQQLRCMDHRHYRLL